MLKIELQEQFPTFKAEIQAEIDGAADADEDEGDGDDEPGQITEKKAATIPEYEKDEDGEDVEYMSPHRKQYLDVRAFFDFFVDNIQVFDPLDRPIKGDNDEEINVKSADLRKAIYDMAAMDSQKMSIPLDNQKYNRLMDMLVQEKTKCQDLAQKQIDEARSKGDEFGANFASQGIVQQFEQNMQFLIQNKLLLEIEKIYGEFQQYKEDIKLQTDRAKMFGQAQIIVQASYKYLDDMIQ